MASGVDTASTVMPKYFYDRFSFIYLSTNVFQFSKATGTTVTPQLLSIISAADLA